MCLNTSHKNGGRAFQTRKESYLVFVNPVDTVLEFPNYSFATSSAAFESGHVKGRSLILIPVESNYAIAIASLTDWSSNLVLTCQPMRNKTKTNRTLYALFFPRFEVTADC